MSIILENTQTSKLPKQMTDASLIGFYCVTVKTSYTSIFKFFKIILFLKIYIIQTMTIHITFQTEFLFDS